MSDSESAVESVRELLTLDELTNRVGMSVRNIRFYTTKGLVPPPIRRGRSGYYSPDHVARLELVQELQSHGFTLSAIEKYMAGIPTDASPEDIALHRTMLAPWQADVPVEMSRTELEKRTGRKLSEEDLAVYGRPYPTRESRLPLLQWPRAMPLDGEPADVVARIDAYGKWLADSPDVPKLLLAFEPGPGAMLSAELVDWCAENISGLEIAEHGPAGHHTPEDQPEAIAASLVAWLGGHDLLSGGEG